MSSLLHPTGSEPPQIYWRRRAVVLLAALVLVVAVVVVWPKGTTPAPPDATSTPLNSTSASVAVSPSVSVSVSSTASPTPTAPQACLTQNLQLNTTGSNHLIQGSKQKFTTSITNSGGISCVLNLTASNFALTVTSGSDRIWSTKDCAKWVPTKKLTLKPKAKYTFEVTWPLQRSQATCKTTKAPVNPGTYVGTATFSDTLTDRVVMLITKTA